MKEAPIQEVVLEPVDIYSEILTHGGSTARNR